MTLYYEIKDGSTTYKSELYLIKIKDIGDMPAYLVKSHIMASAHTRVVTYKNGEVYVSKMAAGSDYCEEYVDIENNLVKSVNGSVDYTYIYKINDGEFEKIAEYESEEESYAKYPKANFKEITIKLTDENIDKYVTSNIVADTTNITSTESSSVASGVRDLSGWKDEYKNILKTTEKEVRAEQGDLYYDIFNEYSIHDINNDGMPELLVYSGTCEADWKLTVYTCKDKNSIKTGEVSFSHGVLYVMHGEKYLKFIKGHMLHEIVSKMYLNSDNKLVVEEISNKELGDGEDYEEGDEYLDTYKFTDLSAIDNYTHNY